VRQLNVRLHQLDSADYTPRTGCPRVTIPRQDRQIRLPHLRSHFTTALETAATIAGRGNRCRSSQTAKNCTMCTTSVHSNCSFGCSICPSAQPDSAMCRTVQKPRVCSEFLQTHKVDVLPCSVFLSKNIFEMS
jgi:hypothetical protein